MRDTLPAMASHDSGDPRLAMARAWEQVCDRLRARQDLVLGEGVPDSPQMGAEGFRYLTRFLEAGIRSCVAHADPDYPVFARMIEHDMTWGLDVPDCLYAYAPIRGDASYRIRGWRGTANHIDIQANTGHYAMGNVTSWITVASINGLQLLCDAEGHFDLVLGGRAEDHPDAMNWLPLREDAGFLLVRQYFADWENERPADLEIERIGAPYPAPPPTPDQIRERLERLDTWLDRGAALWERMSRSFLGMGPNTLLLHQAEAASEHSGLAGQAYGIGNFRCAPDEAVIVELTPPACHHWSLSLASWYWESIDYATRQSSLNGHQARIDPDGVLRAVICHDDPGFANWLDPGGHDRGSIAARFLLADHAPKPSLRRVPRHRLDAEMPGDSPRVTTAERAAALDRRRRAVLHRYRI
jgi:hypothetical protein